MSAASSIKQGQATGAADSYNAEVQGLRAQEATNSSDAQAAVVGQQTTDKLGQAGAAFGAGGVDMSGTPLEVMSSLANKGELNRRLTLYQGQVASIGDLNQQALDSAQGAAARSAATFAAGTTLLTGASMTASNTNTALNSNGGGGYSSLPSSQNPMAGGGGSGSVGVSSTGAGGFT